MLLSLLATILIPQGSRTYHVSPSGRDTNAGTEAAPWRSVQYACDHIASGDIVLLHTGTYYERVVIRKPMTLSAAQDEEVALDGAGQAVPADDAAMVLIKNLNRVTVSGLEIRNYITSDASVVPAGILVEGMGTGITLLNNQIHHIQNKGANRDEINAFGLVVYGNSKFGAITNLTIGGNEIHDTKTGWSETLTVNGNVDGFRITGNRIHDVNNIGIDCIGFEGVSPISGKDQARNGVVANNLVWNVTSKNNPAYRGDTSAGGIYVDGGTNILIERNEIHGADIGIEVASERKGKNSSNITVRNNLVTHCGITGIAIGGYDSRRGGTLNCKIVNNTLVQNSALPDALGELFVQHNTKGNLFANNILAASAGGTLMASSTGANKTIGLTSNDNVFYAPSGAKWAWKGRTYTDLKSFVKGSKGDTRSRFGPPGFADPSGNDYQLIAGAIAVNAGKNYGAGTVGTFDLAGNARVQGRAVDAGCYERP